MTPPPALSIIIIFLNERRFIDEAIASVAGQSFMDWELILVDDGSTDGSSDIAARWEQRLPGRIRRLEHPGHANLGMSASRNRGLSEARGEFVTFLDADDTWGRNPIETQIHILNTNPDIAMTFGRTLWWHSWSRRPEDLDKDTVAGTGLPAEGVIEPPHLLLLTLQNEGFTPAGILWRKDFVLKLGGYETSFRGMYEDQAFYAKAFVRARAFLLNECWYRYRRHEAGCCATTVRTGRYRKARHKYLKFVEAHLERDGILHRELWRVLRQQLLPYDYPLLFRVERRLRSLRRSPIPWQQDRYFPVRLAESMNDILPKTRLNPRRQR